VPGPDSDGTSGHGEYKGGMRAAIAPRFAASGGLFGCANASGSKFASPSGVEQVLCRWCGLGDHGVMDVLSSRVLLGPTDPNAAERSTVRRWDGDLPASRLEPVGEGGVPPAGAWGALLH
jgi:hypothetical protein